MKKTLLTTLVIIVFFLMVLINLNSNLDTPCLDGVFTQTFTEILQGDHKCF